MTTENDRIAFYRWCKRNRSLDGLRYRSEAGQQGIICSILKSDTVGLRVRRTVKEISLEELIRNAEAGFDEHGKKELSRLWGCRPPTPDHLQPSIPKRRCDSDTSGRPKLADLVASHVSLLSGYSERSIPEFLEKVGMPFLLGTEFASELKEFRKCFPASKARPPVPRPFDPPVPAQVVDALTGRLQNAARNWERDLETFDIRHLIQYIRFVPASRRSGLVASVAKSDEPAILASQDLFSLYDENRDLLMSLDPHSCGPSVIGYAAHLVGRPSTGEARRLISWLTDACTKEFNPLLKFLQFLVTSKPDLQGDTSFDELSSSDLFLATCYFDNEEAAKRKLDDVKEWDLPNLRKRLDKHEWRKFLVRGAQPRIAEIAFGRILKHLHQDVGASDLNLIEAQNGRLEHPSRKRLPSADWKTSQGERVDVKSNLFWRTKKAKHLGLRGLMINWPDRNDVKWAGFVFHDSSDYGCSWTYVGEMSRRCLMECLRAGSSEKRVLPFLFVLPEVFRWTCAVADQDALNAAKLIVQPELLMGWCLASSAVCKEAWRKHESYRGIAVRFIEVFLQEPPDLPLEFRLWRSLTIHSINECSAGRTDEVGRLLGLIGRMLAGGTAPVCVPRLGDCDDTILHRWCTEVLEPFRNSFDKLTCPRCKRRNFSLTLSRITEGGAIYGKMICHDDCDLALDEITILTHCGKCGTYPLILGVNKLCSECHGLICNRESDSGETCGACRSGCPGVIA